MTEEEVRTLMAEHVNQLGGRMIMASGRPMPIGPLDVDWYWGDDAAPFRHRCVIIREVTREQWLASPKIEEPPPEEIARVTHFYEISFD